MKTIDQADITSVWSMAAVDVPLIAIVDELEALEFLGDDDQPRLRRCASVWHERPSLLPIRARARFHTAQIEALLTALGGGSVKVDDLQADCVRAWAVLINAGNVATMLIAPRNDADYRARADLRRSAPCPAPSGPPFGRASCRLSGQPDVRQRRRRAQRGRHEAGQAAEGLR